MAEHPRRVLVIGLDSAPLAWVQKWVAEGRLPNLKKILERGASGILRTVNPPLSPAAWSSFSTGLLPAKHGVFDHIYRRPDAYDVAPTSSKTRSGQPFWHIISAHGGTVGVINVPETYPPTPVNGVIISGMDTPSDEAEWGYPTTLKDELQNAVGGYKVFGRRSKENLDVSIAGMYETIPMRVKAARYLWETRQPDFMILVFMETDVIQHKCWKYMDPAHPNHQPDSKYQTAIPDIYALADQHLGPWFDALADDTTLILMSDHGAGPLNKFLYLNNWLIREGYVRFKTSALTRLKQTLFQLGLTPERLFDAVAQLRLGLVDAGTNKIKQAMVSAERTTGLQNLFLSWRDVDWRRTRAYALGGNSTGFYINLRGREPQGCVEPGAEYEALRAELMARVRWWRDPDLNLPVVERVFRREELHTGPYADRAPDVIFTTTAEAYVGFGGHEFANNQLMKASALFNAHHRMDGMVALAGPAVQGGGRALEAHQIVDVAPTILHLLGYPLPAEMDGAVMIQALTPEFLAAHPVQHSQPAPVSTPLAPASDYSAEDESQVMKRLADMGYV